MKLPGKLTVLMPCLRVAFAYKCFRIIYFIRVRQRICMLGMDRDFAYIPILLKENRFFYLQQ